MSIFHGRQSQVKRSSHRNKWYLESISFFHISPGTSFPANGSLLLNLTNPASFNASLQLLVARNGSVLFVRNSHALIPRAMWSFASLPMSLRVSGLAMPLGLASLEWRRRTRCWRARSFDSASLHKIPNLGDKIEMMIIDVDCVRVYSSVSAGGKYKICI